MKKVIGFLSLGLCLCFLLSGCGGRETTSPSATSAPQGEGGADPAADDPYASNPEAAQAASEALQSALDEDPETGINWQEGILQKVPSFSADAILVDWAATDTAAALSYQDTTKADLDRYIDQLEADGFTGSETIIGGADMAEALYTHESRGISVHLLYSAPTAAVEYSTFSIAVNELTKE